MTGDKAHAQALAKAAAQGVAIALASRLQPGEVFEQYRIICGIPAWLFEVTLTAHETAGVGVGAVSEHTQE